VSIAALTEAKDGPRSKRAAILATAVTKFGEVGYEATKWSDVADEVGIGQTALYHYFESKVHCLLTIMSTELERSYARTQQVTAEIDDPAEKIRAAVLAAFDVTPREALQARILMSHQDLLVGQRSSDREEAERQRARGLVRDIEHEWAELIRDGMVAGAFERRDELVLSRLLLGTVNSVWRWYRPDGAHTLAEIAELTAGACVRLAR
jgi:TetR/AcrR family transcriptional regulator, cholesterol catabolism regulator